MECRRFSRLAYVALLSPSCLFLFPGPYMSSSCSLASSIASFSEALMDALRDAERARSFVMCWECDAACCMRTRATKSSSSSMGDGGDNVSRFKIFAWHAVGCNWLGLKFNGKHTVSRLPVLENPEFSPSLYYLKRVIEEEAKNRCYL